MAALARVLHVVLSGPANTLVNEEWSHLDGRMKRRYYSWDECMKLREVQSLRKLRHPNIGMCASVHERSALPSSYREIRPEHGCVQTSAQANLRWRESPTLVLLTLSFSSFSHVVCASPLSSAFSLSHSHFPVLLCSAVSTSG